MGEPPVLCPLPKQNIIPIVYQFGPFGQEVHKWTYDQNVRSTSRFNILKNVDNLCKVSLSSNNTIWFKIDHFQNNSKNKENKISKLLKVDIFLRVTLY